MGLQTVRLRERIGAWRDAESRVDRQSRVVQNIALAGGESRNGYQYSPQALEQAVPLYDQRPVFLDHGHSQSRPHERSARDLAGSIQNVRFEQGRIRGDIHVLETEAGQTLLALVESNTQAVGMSHVVLARRSADLKTVEQIEEVISVDAVVFPATTTTFQEQTAVDLAETVTDSWEAWLAEMDRVLRELKTQPRRVATFTDYVVTATEEDRWEIRRWKRQTEGEVSISEVLRLVNLEELNSGAWRAELEETPSDRSEPGVLPEQKLQKRYRRLLQKYVALGRKQRIDERVQKLLNASGLEQEAITPAFVQLLKETTEETRQRELIADRQSLWRGVERRGPGSTRRGSGERDNEEELFIRAIRH